MSNKETSHYVVTAHPPGGVWMTAKCNFMSEHSADVVVVKSRRLEVRQLRAPDKSHIPSPFPVVLQVPLNGSVTSLLAIPSHHTSSYLFFTTAQLRYAVISHDPSQSPYPIRTHASGSLQGEDHGILGRPAECGPIVAMDPFHRCIALHIYDGLITIIPINLDYKPVQAAKGGPPLRSESQSILGPVFHCRIEERIILAMTFLQSESADSMPQLCILHQDARSAQHVISHLVNLKKQQLHLFGSHSAPASTQWLKKTSVDGGSSILIPIAPRVSTPTAAAAAATNDMDDPTAPPPKPWGGVLILGQRQFTFCSPTFTKVVPVPQGLFLTWERLPPDPSNMPRYLIGDEFGNLHMVTLLSINDKIVSIQMDTLGSCTLSSSLSYLSQGLVYVGSKMGDSQLVQIHDEPIAEEEDEDIDLVDTTYLSVVEEYTHLGPILDFDLVPTTPGATLDPQTQSQVVTASGTSKSGSLRLIRNGIGMNEYASVEIPGIQNMWSVRSSFAATYDAYLVQSFVGETRVLGVAESRMETDSSQDEGGTLEEVFLPGLDSSASSLYVGNVQEGDRLLQVTEMEIRLLETSGSIVDSWAGAITVAAANEAGQIAVAMSGGKVLYFRIEAGKIVKLCERQMDNEISCLDVHPLAPGKGAPDTMDTDEPIKGRTARLSSLMAVGLWDDFTVRLLAIDNGLEELVCIHLGTEEEEETNEDAAAADTQRRSRTNMMSRSLCLVTLDFSPSNISAGVSSQSGADMLFIGLGDGTLISFAVVSRDGKISVHSKKEVSLGTQRIDLVPLATDLGGTCVLATGDRPTVIYLAGVAWASSSHFNPKLCYSNVNLSASEDEDGDGVSRLPSQQAIAVNVAASFFSPLLFDVSALGNQHYSLCVADDSNLRLGVIDDIQKLHVTTCRLGMAPRRIVHCPDGRLFAVGCVESGIKHFGLGNDESNMGNCIRFMDETTFDDLERIDMEPFEMILSMQYVTLKVPVPADGTEGYNAEGENPNSPVHRPFLLVGTAYALPDEDEPSRGRIVVYSFQADDATASNSGTRAVRQVTEMSVPGGVYSMCQFYEGRILCAINTKTMMCQLVDDMGVKKLQFVGTGHHGHILSLSVKSRAKRSVPPSALRQNRLEESKEEAKPEEKSTEMLAIVGDLMRSMSLVQYYPQHDTLEEIARDFQSNWVTAVEMLNDYTYLGAENWNNLYCLRRKNSASEEIRCRLDTTGEYHLGEMVNKFMCGSLVMPASSSSHDSKRRRRTRRLQSSPSKKASSPTTRTTAASAASAGVKTRRPIVVTGSQTLFGTVEGTLGVILGLDGRTTAFFCTLERAMATVIRPVGDLSHAAFHACQAENRINPAHGFVDGDLIESFLDLDRSTMDAVVTEMNRDGGWDVDDVVLRPDKKDDEEETREVDRVALSVDDVLAMVEEMAMLH